MMDFKTATPAEVDTAWNEAWIARDTAASRTAHDLWTFEESKKKGWGFSPKKEVRRMSLTDILERIEEIVSMSVPEDATPWDRTDHEKRVERLTKGRDAIEAANDTIEAANREWKERGGWARYFLVTSSNKGHVHLNGCGSWRWTTQVAIVVSHSGEPREKVVEDFGTTACTRCFPEAPVANGPADDGKCRAGNGYDHDRDAARGQRYSKCNVCGYIGALTTTGKMRAHKPADK